MKQAMTLVNVMTRDVQGPMGVPWGPRDQVWQWEWDGTKNDFLEQAKH